MSWSTGEGGRWRWWWWWGVESVWWGVGGGVNKTNGITRTPSQRLGGVFWENGARGFFPHSSASPHLLPLSVVVIRKLRCAVSTRQRPSTVHPVPTAPRPRSTPAPIKGTQRGAARATVRGPVTHAAARALCFIWICLGLFVGSPVFMLADWQGDNPQPLPSTPPYLQKASC